MTPSFNKLKGKNILITGGLGFIGSNLAKKCVESGANVTLYDSFEKHSGANKQNIKEFENKIKIVQKDIRSVQDIQEAVKNKDILFNCAAYTSHPDSMREPLIDVDVNCKGVLTVLDAVRRINPRVKFVHIGTSTQIGKMLHSPITELHPEFPLDIYSANKCAAEKYVLLYAHAYEIDATVLRLVNVYGPGSNIKSSDFGFINYFIGLGLQGKTMTVFGKGKQLRNILYVDDAVSALILAAVSSKSKGQVYFVSTTESFSVSQLATFIKTLIGGSIDHVSWPEERYAIETGDAVISNRKIVKELGWRPRVFIHEGLKRTKSYFRTRLPYYLS